MAETKNPWVGVEGRKPNAAMLEFQFLMLDLIATNDVQTFCEKTADMLNAVYLQGWRDKEAAVISGVAEIVSAFAR